MGAPSTTRAGDSSNDDDLRKPHAVAGNDTNGSAGGGAQAYLSLIQQYLSVFMVENATFLADRCVAEYPDCSQAVYLLALCHYRAGKPQTARHILERFRSVPPVFHQKQQENYHSTVDDISSASSILYLAAQCSYELKEYSRAEDALLRETRTAYKQRPVREGGPVLSLDDWILQTSPCPVPNGAAGLALLGNIYRKSNRHERAIKYYRMSLQLDPFLWTSFQALAELGESVEPTSIFGVLKNSATAPSNHPAATSTSSMAAASHGLFATKTPLQPMKTPTSFGGPTSGLLPPRGQATQTAFETPGLTPIPMHNNASFLPAAETPRSVSFVQRQESQSVVSRARQVASRQYYPPSPDTPITNVTRSMRYLHGLSGMDTSIRSRNSTNNNAVGAEARSLFLTSENHNRLSTAAAPSSGGTGGGDDSFLLQKPEKSDEKIQGILEVLAIAGAAYQELCQYKCREALETLRRLPRRQQATAWVLHQQGRAFLELGDFTSAQRCLEHMHRQEPGRMKGLELLSTVYWQLKKEVELASLAQRVVEWDRVAPEAWCVVGNCFSLQKDHESALFFFQRSLQLDPDFTYTHTLCGYEYMANEDFDKAMACFRQALRTNDRHYNAWYGLGGIYHRQEKFDLAEYHFERACSIHPTSSILRCNLGVAQYANGKAYVALETLSEASRLDPRNPQARFQRATIYTALHRPEEALVELERVRDAAPREATVYFAMGKVLKRLGRSDEAMKCFLSAMDLDPKDSQLFKSAMDKLDDPDIDEEAMTPF